MQLLSLTTLNKIILDDDKINEDNYVIKYSLIDEMGKYIKNDSATELKDVEANYDDKAKRYAAKFMLDPQTKSDEARLIFNIKDREGCFVQSNKYLVDCQIDKQVNNIQLVSASQFRDYLLGMAANDVNVEARIKAYPDSQFLEWLSASHSQVERELEMCLTRRTMELEKTDYFGDDIRSTWWLIYTQESPIIQVNSYELWVANQKIMSVEPSYIMVRKIEGELQFIPTSGTDNSSQAVFINHLEAAMLGKIFTMGGDYVPSMFRFSYDHGLDYMNMSKNDKADIRLAIVRKTLLDNLMVIRPDLLRASESVSADGASFSFSNQLSLFTNKEEKNYDTWVTNMKRKYLKLYKMASS